jgi:hypothetical protein
VRVSISGRQANGLYDGCDCREDDVQDMQLLNGGDGRWLIQVFLAARMAVSPHVAVPRHLLTALHLDFRHRRCRKTGESRRSRPDQDENERQDGTPLHHEMMLHLQRPSGKGRRTFLWCVAACWKLQSLRREGMSAAPSVLR